MADKPYFVNVNGHTVKSNTGCALAGSLLKPIFAVRYGRGGKPTYGREVSIVDKDGVMWAQLAYEPFGGLGCGAKAFLVCREKPQVVTGEYRQSDEVTPEVLENVKDLKDDIGVTAVDLLLYLQDLVKICPHLKIKIPTRNGPKPVHLGVPDFSDRTLLLNTLAN